MESCYPRPTILQSPEMAMVIAIQRVAVPSKERQSLRFTQ
jgi:hypothetical protein